MNIGHGSSNKMEGLSSSSRSRGTSDRREVPAFPSKITIIDTDTAFQTSLTEPQWCAPEFGDRCEIKNVNDKTCLGTIVAAGTMFPLGAAFPANTVLKYGCYLPPGTMLPDGALVPIHNRLVSVIPMPTSKTPDKPPAAEAVWCTIM